MEYDPIKFKLARLLGRCSPLRRLFFCALDLLFLRAWYVRRELWKLRRKLGLNAAVLDAGMGFGQYTDRMLRTFAAPDVYGLEIDRKHIYGGERYFKSNYPNLQILLGDVQKTPLNRERFDLILSVDVMEHIEDDVATFGEFHRILKNGGYFLMHTPRDKNQNNADRRHSDENRWTVDEHFRDGYSDKDIQQKLESAGFRIVKIARSYGALGMFAWHLLQGIPMRMLGRSSWMIPPAALYILFIYPLAFFAMLLDVAAGNHRNGNGLLVLAQKND